MLRVQDYGSMNQKLFGFFDGLMAAYALRHKPA